MPVRRLMEIQPEDPEDIYSMQVSWTFEWNSLRVDLQNHEINRQQEESFKCIWERQYKGQKGKVFLDYNNGYSYYSYIWGTKVLVQLDKGKKELHLSRTSKKSINPK